MTFLPIVERELRVAARRKGTYLTRVGVGLAALVFAGVSALVALVNPTVRFGTVYLEMMSGLALAYCLGAGRFLTADCLSSEKREETMGLLFLTDLKGYDVVLGKMAATSLNGLYGLLALLPVMAMTLLTGGITNGELLRVVLVLVEAFYFSLAIGMFASALTREFRAAMAANFYLLLGLAGLVPLVAWLVDYFSQFHTVAPEWFYPCPIFTLTLAFDASYRQAAMDFWSSAGFVFALSLLLVGRACQIAPQSWQHKAVKPVNKPTAARQLASWRAADFRAEMLNRNAYLWLAARPWWKARTVWFVLAAGLVWLATMRISIGWLDEAVCVMVALTLNGTLKFWIALEAGQTLAEDMQIGSFELLLSTPLTARDIIAGQVLALRRQFFKPLLALAALEIFFMVTLLLSHPKDTAYEFCFWTACIAVLAADVVTLTVVAMTSALTEKNITRALLNAIRWVMIFPWVLWGLVMAFRGAWLFLFANQRETSWGFGVAWWAGISLALDLLLARRAWHQLSRHFRELALRRYAEASPSASLRARSANLFRALRDHIWRRPRVRKLAIGLVSVLALGFSLKVWDSNRSHNPPPEIVAIGPDIGTKLQAIASGEGVLLILPDGSLWRWGFTDGTNRARLPEPIGTNRDWTTLSGDRQLRLGVRRDGTLWEWSGPNGPRQIGEDTDWVEAAGTQTSYKVARKKDGTLWGWGDVGVNRRMGLTPSPAPVWLPSPPATEHVWKSQSRMPFVVARGGTGNRVAGPRSYALGVDADGTLWVWGVIRLGSAAGMVTNLYENPIQVCRETNWISVTAGMAQNRLGELWSFFFAPPNPAAPASTMGAPYRTQNPVLIDTNRDWTALAGEGNCFFALRANGGLYSWGPVFFRSPGGVIGPGARIYLSAPTQICAETNWVGLDSFFGARVARNQAGQFWSPNNGFNPAYVPGPKVPIGSSGQLIASFASNNQTISAAPPQFRPDLELYEVHPDGTLWFRPVSYTGVAGSALIGPPQRADQRTDWVAVAVAGNAAFGLTTDGTLWTWGWNLGESPTVGTQSRLSVLGMQVQHALASGPTTSRIADAEPKYEIQEKPRALMKLIPAK